MMTRLEIGVQLAILLILAVGSVMLLVSTKPADVQRRVEALEQKLQVTPADVLREVGALRAEVAQLRAANP